MVIFIVSTIGKIQHHIGVDIRVTHTLTMMVKSFVGYVRLVLLDSYPAQNRRIVLENVRLAAHSADKNSMDLRRNAYKFPDVLAAAHKCLEMVGLSAKALSIAGSLAHGDKRRLEIAIVLAAKSDVVLLDEPMAGMAVENVPGLVEIIRSLKTVHGKTVLIVEHLLKIHLLLGTSNVRNSLFHLIILAGKDELQY